MKAQKLISIKIGKIEGMALIKSQKEKEKEQAKRNKFRKVKSYFLLKLQIIIIMFIITLINLLTKIYYIKQFLIIFIIRIIES